MANVTQQNDATGTPIYTLDAQGNVTYTGDLTLGKVGFPQIPQPGTVTLYTTDGTSINMVDSTGAKTVISSGTGTDTFPTLIINPGPLVVGSATTLGDNGVGEIQLANATSVPSTNPTGGLDIYAHNGGIFVRDPNGTVSSLVTTLRTGATSFGAIAETINHNAATQTVIQPASGELQLMSVGIEAGQTISNVGFCVATTAANGPTHWWACILDVNYKLMAHSADQTSTALPANTWQKLAMVTPYTTTYTGMYFIGIMVATSVSQPSILAAQVPSAFVTGTNAPTPGIGGRSSTGLTTPGTDNTTTYTTPAAIGGFYHAYAI